MIQDGWGAMGFSTNDPGRFQGYHNERLIFIIDEANAFPEKIWEAIDSCVVSAKNQVIAIGNPIQPHGRFFRGFSDPSITKFHLSSREHPNVIARKELIPGAVTAEWIEEFEQSYKSFPNIIISRIDGIFPTASVSSLISMDLIARAMLVEPKTKWPVILSLDVARFGDSLNVLTEFQGQLCVKQEEWGKTDTVGTADRVETRYRRAGASSVVIDITGVGAGVFDILKRRGINVIPFVAGEKAKQKNQFFNSISEAWFLTKEALSNGLFSLGFSSSDLEVQLTMREYCFRSDKKFQIERKEDYRARTGFPSPDHADSFVMGAAHMIHLWGKIANA